MGKLRPVVLLVIISFLMNAAVNISCVYADPIKNKYKNFELSLGAEIGSFQPEKSSYLGTQIGAGPNVFNFVEVGDNLNFNSAGINFGYQVHKNNISNLLFRNFIGLKITGGVEQGRADQNKNFGTLDPMGNNLLIPGVGVGPAGAGFLLPGANNQITGARYDAEFDYYKFKLGVESVLKMPNSAIILTPSAGLEYGRTITDNSFAGNIPFFIRSFSYNTKTDVRTISSTIGLDMSYKINSIFDVFGGAKYAYDFNNGEGTDSLSFTGIADQVAKTESDRNTHSYGLKAGVDIDFNSPAIFTIQGNYKRLGNIPVLKVRDGSNISDFSYEDADIFSGTVRATFKF